MADSQILQVTHDMANIIQALIAIAEDEVVDLGRIKSVLSRSGILVKIYSLIYNKNAPLEDGIELIQLYNNRSIEFTRDFTINNIYATRLVLLYCLWLTKYTDLELEIDQNLIILKSSTENLRPLMVIQDRVSQEIVTAGNLTFVRESQQIKIVY